MRPCPCSRSAARKPRRAPPPPLPECLLLHFYGGFSSFFPPSTSSLPFPCASLLKASSTFGREGAQFYHLEIPQMWRLTHYAPFPSLVHGGDTVARQQCTQKAHAGCVASGSRQPAAARKVGEKPSLNTGESFYLFAHIQHTLRLPAPPLLGRGAYFRAPPLIACVHAFFCRSPCRCSSFFRRPYLPSRVPSSLLPRGRFHPSPTRLAAPHSSCCCLFAPAQPAQNAFPATPLRWSRSERVGAAVLFVELPHMPQRPAVRLLRGLCPVRIPWQQPFKLRLAYK